MSKLWSLSNGKIIAGILGLSGLLVMIGLVVGGRSAEEESTRQSKVAATIYPLYDIVSNIIPKEVGVLLIVPPGSSPHTFEISPSAAVEIANADLVFGIDHGIDGWIIDAVADLDEKKYVGVDTDIVLMELEHGHEDTDDDDESLQIDPHYWLSVPNAMIIVRNVSEYLVAIYPEYESEIRENQKNYVAKLVVLDREIRGMLEGLENKRIATFHESFNYFARDYGLEVAAVFEETVGVTPGPKQIAEFITTSRDKNVRAIFSEPQFSSSDISTTARDAGVKLSQLDPIGGVEGKMSYIEMMRFNADEIVYAGE